MEGIKVEDFEDLNSKSESAFVSELAGEKEVISSAFISTGMTGNDETMKSTEEQPKDTTPVQDLQDFSQIPKDSSSVDGIGTRLPKDANRELGPSTWEPDSLRCDNVDDTSREESLQTGKNLKDINYQTVESRENEEKWKAIYRKYDTSDVEKSRDYGSGTKEKPQTATAPTNPSLTSTSSNQKTSPNNATTKKNPKARKIIIKQEKSKASFSCLRCSASFLTNNQLKDHQKLHKSPTSSHSCPLCGKTFPSGWKLQRHQLIHSKDKKFLCEKCGKAFTQAQHLKGHAIVHMDKSSREEVEKYWKYQCQYCQKKLRTASLLEIHLPHHTGDKNFKCSYCDKKFTLNCSKTRHEKSQHLANS